MIFSISTIDISGHSASFRSYIPDAAPDCHEASARPAVVILPGGGYSITYAGEAEPIALKLCAEGICTFVLDYATAPSGKTFPVALAEALTAVKKVRDNAKKFGIDPHNISTLGFSAGGHLASCTGTLWNSSVLDGYLEGDRADHRPDKMILCYPVISSESFSHKGSFENLFGKTLSNLTEEEKLIASTEKQVGAHTPPTFIWTTAEDGCVPVRNSLAMATALAENSIPFELYVYPHGNHGLCTADHVTKNIPFGSEYQCAEWTEKAVRFIFDGFGGKS